MQTLIRAPIYTLGYTAVGGSTLIVAAGAKGRRFVLEGERYEINLASRERTLDQENQDTDAFADMEGSSAHDDTYDDESEPQKFADYAGAIKNSNARFLKLLKRCCGSRVIPLIQKLSGGDVVQLSARDMVRYGLTDHVITRKNRKDFFVNVPREENNQ